MMKIFDNFFLFVIGTTTIIGLVLFFISVNKGFEYMIYAGINLILSFVGIIGFNSYVKLMDIEKKLKGSHNTSNENDRLQGWISVQLSEKKMVINSIKGKEKDIIQNIVKIDNYIEGFLKDDSEAPREKQLTTKTALDIELKRIVLNKALRK